MGKNIVVLNGSPRSKGNTSALVREFTRGAEEAGHTVTEFFLDGMDIHGCKGCFGGHSGRDCPCVQQDDMDKIYPGGNKIEPVVYDRREPSEIKVFVVFISHHGVQSIHALVQESQRCSADHHKQHRRNDPIGCVLRYRLHHSLGDLLKIQIFRISSHDPGQIPARIRQIFRFYVPVDPHTLLFQ